MIIEDAVTRTDNSLAVACWVPRDPQSGSDVVVVARNSFDNFEGAFRGLVDRGSRSEDRREFDIVAHAVIDCKFIGEAPAVLEKSGECFIVQGPAGISDTLDEGGGQAEAVGLNAGGAGQ